MRARSLASPRRPGLRVCLALMAVMAAACGGGGETAVDSADVVASPDAATSEPGSVDTTTDQTAAAESPAAEAENAQGVGEECQDLYGGETLTFVVPFSAAGGFDAYARLIAPYLEESLGATVVVENRPGAGGLLALNNLATATPDGTLISFMDGPGSGGAAIAKAEGVQFALDELSYVGRVVPYTGVSSNVLVTAADSQYEDMDDVLAAESFRFGSTGPGSSNYVIASLLIEVLGVNAEILTGFPGSSEIALALLRGDVDGMTGAFDSRIPAVEAGDERPLLNIDSERHPGLPDTPAVLEIEVGEEERRLGQALVDLLDLGRLVVAPPDVPQDRLECLRGAFSQALQDDELVSEAEQAGRPVDYLPGQDLEALVQDLLGAPPRFTEVLEAAYAGASS